MNWERRGCFAVILNFEDTLDELEHFLDKQGYIISDWYIIRKYLILKGISNSLTKFGYTGQAFHEYSFNLPTNLGMIESSLCLRLVNMVSMSLELNKFLSEIGNLTEITFLECVITPDKSIFLTINNIKEK